jgi:hypothetical protein
MVLFRTPGKQNVIRQHRVRMVRRGEVPVLRQGTGDIA